MLEIIGKDTAVVDGLDVPESSGNSSSISRRHTRVPITFAIPPNSVLSYFSRQRAVETSPMVGQQPEHENLSPARQSIASPTATRQPAPSTSQETPQLIGQTSASASIVTPNPAPVEATQRSVQPVQTSGHSNSSEVRTSTSRSSAHLTTRIQNRSAAESPPPTPVSSTGLGIRRTLSAKRKREEEEILLLQSKRKRNEAQESLFKTLQREAELKIELLNRQLNQL